MTIDIYGRIVPTSDELYHFGIKGMHWGIRRFQPYPKGYSGKGEFTGKTSVGKRMDKERDKVYSLYDKGMTVEQIYKKTGFNRDAINDYLGELGYFEVNPRLNPRRSKDESSEGKRPNDELKFLAEANERDDLTEKDYNRFAEMMQEISNKSVDWYYSEPKTDRTRKIYEQYDKKIAEIEETLEKPYLELREAEWERRRKHVEEFDRTNVWPKKGTKEEDEYFDKYSNWMKLFEYSDEYKKAKGKYEHAESLAKAWRDSKLVDAVLRDLGFAVTDENREYILKSGVLFWD